MTTERHRTEICIVGGGPAGLVLALLLGRAGHAVTVVEAAERYERSFRGESIQPDTVSILYDLGVADDLARHGWTETRGLVVSEKGRTLLDIDSASKPYRHRYMVDLPQNVLLETLAAHIGDLPGVQILRGAKVTALRHEGNGRVAGVRYQKAAASGEVEAMTTVAADGRYSRTRQMAGLEVERAAMTRDFIWCKLPRPTGWTFPKTRILLNGTDHLVLLPTHPDLLRVGFNIPKGGYAAFKRGGLSVLYDRVNGLDVAFGAHFRKHVRDWSDFQFLEIFTALATRWGVPGLLLIGDCAHTLTPLLGQGVNIAVEDAVVLVPMLSEHLRAGGTVDDAFVARFQAMREPQVRRLLRMQMTQERLLAARGPLGGALRRGFYTALHRIPLLQRRMYDGVTYRRQRALRLRG